MTPLQHPASLNALGKYRQACNILETTSRASRLAWYKEALVLEFQLHIVIDGASISSYFYELAKDSWNSGPEISEETITDLEETTSLVENLITKVQLLNGRHIGIIIHIADEFATAELQPKFDNPAALNELRETVYETPREVLEDASIPEDQGSWRVIPYPAAGSAVIGTSISVSRNLELFISNLRDLGNNKNFPIITHALSAPLVVISSLSDIIRPSTNKPFVAVLQYPWFTAMAFFNEHLDLRLIRSLQHRGQRCPSNLWNTLATTNVSLEFLDPDIYLLPLGDHVDTASPDELRFKFPNSLIERINFPESSHVHAWNPEPILSVADTSVKEGDEVKSHTFGTLRSERWFLQDFLSPSKEAQALFPTRNEIRVLRFFKITKRIALAAFAIWLLWSGFGIIRTITQEEWSFDENEAVIVQQKGIMLNKEKNKLQHWHSLLEDRSKAWTTMEMLSRLYPQKSGMLLNSFTYSARPDSGRAQVNVGYIKEWKMTGLARNDAMDYLNKLNTREGMAEKFVEIFETTGDVSFNPSPTTRSLVVDLKMQENRSFMQRPQEDIYDSDETTYPFRFDLIVTQRFESTDVMAIPVSKAPE